ncbi:MAG: SpoIID/LytB domain-containing protein [Bdellovibrionota bacterium]
MCCILLSSCAKHISDSSVTPYRKPQVILHSQPLGDGGFLSRDLFRSYWTPPSSDDDLITVGVVLSEKEIRFRSDQNFLIRVYNDQSSMDIASPGGVLWRVKDLTITRPPLIRYFAISDEVLLHQGKNPDESKAQALRDQGFSFAKWVGPPKMDAIKKPSRLQRWFLSYHSFKDKSSADHFCGHQKNTNKLSCKVISRVGLPPQGSGILKAHQSSFVKGFEGIIEIISPDAPIEVLEVKNDIMSNELSHGQLYGPRLFIIPNAEGNFSMVQQTQFTDYLEGVVPAETFPNAHLEALKTQAIIARTYALSHAPIEFSSMPFFTCASTRCQVYRGQKIKTSRTNMAVEQTKNLVLRERDGSFAQTYYHSVCGGHTENKVSSLGGQSVAYLKGVTDRASDQGLDLHKTHDVREFILHPQQSYCEVSSYSPKSKYRWNKTFSHRDLRAIAKNVGLAEDLEEIEILRRGVSGRVERMQLSTRTQKKTLYGELTIRNAFENLPSSLFVMDLHKSGSSIHTATFHGGGFGHGVGLCQIGAIGRAEKGQSFQTILQAYYPGLILDEIVP